MTSDNFEKPIAPAKGVQRLFNASRWSILGLRSTLKHEAAFRQEVVLLIVLGPLGIWLGDTGVERALLAGSVLLVLIVELLNSAIESAIDRIGRDRHELSGRAKDQGSAAVALSIVLAALCWVAILWN